MSRLLILFVLLLAGFRCESVSTFGAVCTELGCDSGLIVQLQSAPPAPYRIEAHVPGAVPRYVQTCSTQASCGSTVFFKEFTPDHVIIEVISGLETQRYEVRPIYQRERPNGPGCDPVCRTATVRLPQDALGT